MASLLEIQAGRVSRWLQKFSGVKGTARMVIGGELTPQITLGSGAENRYLEGWNRFAVGANETAGGVSAGGLRLRNPANSKMVAVFEKLDLESSIAADTVSYQIAAQTADLGVLGSFTNARLDPRGAQTPVLVPSSATSGVSIPGAATGQIVIAAANTPYAFIATDFQELTLFPGDSLTMTATSITAKLSACLLWRERSLEDSELQ